jgi:hypothetical protein
MMGVAAVLEMMTRSAARTLHPAIAVVVVAAAESGPDDGVMPSDGPQMRKFATRLACSEFSESLWFGRLRAVPRGRDILGD